MFFSVFINDLGKGDGEKRDVAKFSDNSSINFYKKDPGVWQRREVVKIFYIFFMTSCLMGTVMQSLAVIFTITI